MTIKERVSLVEEAWRGYGLNRALAAIDLPKSTWYYHRNEKVDPEQKEVAYTDSTELRYADGAYKAYLMPFVGHAGRIVLGWAVGISANTDLALAAWQDACQTLEDWQHNPGEVIVHHDQNPVYTSYRWTGQLLIEDEVRLSYALNGAKDNPYMEAFFSRFKTENGSLFLDAESIEELTQIVEERIIYYNTERRHSSLGYQAPMTIVREHLNGKGGPQISH